MAKQRIRLGFSIMHIQSQICFCCDRTVYFIYWWNRLLLWLKVYTFKRQCLDGNYFWVLFANDALDQLFDGRIPNVLLLNRLSLSCFTDKNGQWSFYFKSRHFLSCFILRNPIKINARFLMYKVTKCAEVQQAWKYLQCQCWCMGPRFYTCLCTETFMLLITPWGGGQSFLMYAASPFQLHLARTSQQGQKVNKC